MAWREIVRRMYSQVGLDVIENIEPFTALYENAPSEDKTGFRMESATYDGVAGLTTMTTRNTTIMARSCKSDSSECGENQNTLESHLDILEVLSLLSEKLHRGK